MEPQRSSPPEERDHLLRILRPCRAHVPTSKAVGATNLAHTHASASSGTTPDEVATYQSLNKPQAVGKRIGRYSTLRTAFRGLGRLMRGRYQEEPSELKRDITLTFF